MSTATPSPSLRSLFSELEQLFHSETEARVSTSVQAAERALAEHLNQAVRRLRQASTFAEIAGILCDASVRFAKVCAVFHINEHAVGGERLRGANGPAAEQFHQIQFAPSSAAAFAGAIETRDPVVALCSPAEVSPAVVEALGHAPGDKAYLYPLTVDRTTVGILYAAGDVDSAALELLAQATAMALEARQRPVRREAAAASADLVNIATAPTNPPAKDWDDLSTADRQLHLRAQRFARVEVAEMRLHRPDAVKAGRAQQDLYVALQDAIDRGREMFRQKFMNASPTMVDYFHLELVRTLANDNPAWLGRNIRGGWSDMQARALVCAALVPWLAANALAQTPESLGRAYRESPTPAKAKALERYAASHKDINGALAHLNLGVVAFEQKRFPAAIQYLKAAQAPLPKLADYVAYYLAAAETETQDSAGAAHNAAIVRRAPIASRFSAKSIVLEARGLAASGAAQDAVRMLREHYADLPQPDGDLALAIAYEAARELSQAAHYYQRVYYEYPAGDAATRAAAALINIRESMGAAYPVPPSAALLERANRLLVQHEYQRAQAEFEALVPQLSGAERDQARVGVAAAQYLAGDATAAYSRLRSLEVSDGEANAERLFYIGACARKLNDDDQMMEAVKKLAKYSESQWRYKALVDAGNRFLVTNQPDKYVPLYKTIYETFPDQPMAVAGRWRVAWAAYIRRRHDARELLRQHLERYPGTTSASAALYFLGRLAETERDLPAARAYYVKLDAQFPNYYYGILARERVRLAEVAAAGPSEKTAQFLRTIAFPPHKPVVPGEPDADTALRIARARLLQSAGLPDQAQAELRFGARNGGQTYLLAMEMARSGTTPHERLHNIKAAAPDYLSLSLEDAPQAFWQLLFPLPFEKDLVANAKQQNLDPYMMAALIRQESEFDPQALSAKKAYGLTQVEPATGRALARRAGIKKFSNRSLFQPAINLKLGSYYLRALLDQWGGKWEETLASYNAGKSRVNDWITWNQYLEPAEFVESIPFTETREYVEAVLRNATLYRQLYGSKAPPPAPERKAVSVPARKPHPV